jgi:hypothetical protein
MTSDLITMRDWTRIELGCHPRLALVEVTTVAAHDPGGIGLRLDWSGSPTVVNAATDSQRQTFYEQLLTIRWLAPKVRNAVMTELGKSVRAEKLADQQVSALGLRLLVDDTKQRMRANGERPQGGIHDAALTKVASHMRLTVPALRQRLRRSKKLRS